MINPTFLTKLIVITNLVLSIDAKCGKPSPWKPGESGFINMTVQDENFGATTRQFIVSMPENYDSNKKYPVFFYMHGQGCHGIENAHYVEQQKNEAYIAVYPQGMGDLWKWNQNFYSWNVPLKKDDMNVCEPTTETMCYDSCGKLGNCYTCSWCTCYDDL
jgi:poly(3-hydroxybutyrate) depolymerase